jgi:hypothetical protein
MLALPRSRLGAEGVLGRTVRDGLSRGLHSSPRAVGAPGGAADRPRPGSPAAALGAAVGIATVGAPRGRGVHAGHDDPSREPQPRHAPCPPATQRDGGVRPRAAGGTGCRGRRRRAPRAPRTTRTCCSSSPGDSRRGPARAGPGGDPGARARLRPIRTLMQAKADRHHGGVHGDEARRHHGQVHDDDAAAVFPPRASTTHSLTHSRVRALSRWPLPPACGW